MEQRQRRQRHEVRQNKVQRVREQLASIAGLVVGGTLWAYVSKTDH